MSEATFQSDFNLVEQVTQLQSDASPANKRAFYLAMTRASFLIPCRGEKKNVAMLTSPKGEKFIPIFDSAETAKVWKETTDQMMPIKFRDLLKVVHKDQANLDGIAINAMSQQTLLLRQQQLGEIDALTRGDAAGGKVRLRLVTDYPSGLPVELQKLLSEYPLVYRVWLLLVEEQDGSSSHKMVLIDFDGDSKLLYKSVSEVVRPFMSKGDTFELRKANIQMLQAAEKLGKPIYAAATE